LAEILTCAASLQTDNHCQIVAQPDEFCTPKSGGREFHGENLPTSVWYDACTPLSALMATKMPSTYSEADRNWQWPEKTWFQERLNSIKAREQEQRRKSATSAANDIVNESASQTSVESLKLD
jgi:hypothetical protein